jgi:diguanylate cyclase (GGDEF)-like protein
MPAAPISEQEEKRLAAVKKLKLMGTPAEERFDKITRLARQIFNVPMAVINILGEKIAWMKSVQGTIGVEALRKDTYCYYTVLKDGVCLINDAHKDLRVFDSLYADTWVFYAGVPLHFEGQRVGALCIGDNIPRAFDDDQMRTLVDLATLAERELEIASLSESQLVLALSNKELEKKANIDALTHIWNRCAILEIANKELQHSSQHSLTALLMIDVDNYKNINDTYGHISGDVVLQNIAERLRMAVRPCDAVGRYGGDEFLAVLINIPTSEVKKIANRVCKKIYKTPIIFEDRAIPVTCSVGYSIYRAFDDVYALLERADHALYKSKSKGRNRAEGS